MSEKDSGSNSKEKEKRPMGNDAQKANLKKLLLRAGCVVLIFVLISLLLGKDGMTQLFNELLGTNETFLDTGGDQLVVTYLDVGQSDCTILQCGESTMMIDGGSRGMAQVVIDAAKELGIERFDYVVATHSHEDHIGGLPKVIRAFEVENVVFRDENKDTKIYKDFKEAVKESGAEVIVPKPGVSFKFGNALVEIFAPREMEYSNTNNYSAALLITFGEKKFLFTGDAEEESEAQMLELGTLPEVDVFQAGHHGSETSNSEAFLKVIDPVYAVISCGVDNKYGHPHSAVLARFVDMDMQVYRTDVMGNITIKTDGRSMDISTQQKNAE